MKTLLFLAFLAAFALYVHLRAGARERAIEARFPPIGQVLTVDGIRVHALVQGSGPDLVLIHGSSGNLRDFTFAIAGELARSYRVISLDRPGLGYTERLHTRGETIGEQAALLQKAAQQLGAERPIVLGHSYGGAVALAWALDHPDNVSALVLVAAPTQVWDGALPGLYRLNSHPVGSALAVPVLAAFVPQSYIHDQIHGVFDPDPMPQGYDDYVGAELAARRVSQRANAKQRAGLLAQMRQMQPRYGELALPIEVIHGDADGTVGLHIHATPFAEQVPAANLTVLEGAGHLPHQTDMGATLAAIDRAASRAGLR